MTNPDPILWQLLLQVVLILVNAVFACAEIAVISISDTKLEKLSNAGNKKASRLLSLTQQPARFLATIQVGITLAGFLGSAFAADNFSDRLVTWLVGLGVKIPASTLDSISVVVITLILSYFTLVLGELVPKRIAMRNSEAIGLALSGLIYTTAKFFRPIVWFLTTSTNGLLRLLGIDPNANEEMVTEEEIRMMVDAGSERGAIDANEKNFIHNVFEFDNKIASDLMTHRTDVVVLWLEETDEAWERTIKESRFKMYPVCGDSADDVVGVLNTKDYFRLDSHDRQTVLEKAVKAPYFVPETVAADILFVNMKKNRTHFAIALDEYGGMCGILSINDLLEELVGDLDDDILQNAAPEIELLEKNQWRILGSASLEAVEKHLGLILPSSDYNTFGGMVFALLGAIPADGSTPILEAFGMEIKVAEIKDHRLEVAFVTVLTPKKS